MSISPFHIAIPVHNVQQARKFYGGLLGLTQGRREKNKWQDYNFFGHQLVCHCVGEDFVAKDYYNSVDHDDVPVPHFGMCLTVQDWKKLRDKITGKVKFIVEPHLRFEGKPGQQWTMFFKDQSGNNLQFKAMTNQDNLFAKYDVTE